MMQTLVFLFWLIVLGAEGMLLTSLILRHRMNLWSARFFALPLAALINVLLVFTLTILHLPLLFLSMIIGHAIVILILAILLKRSSIHGDIRSIPPIHQTSQKLSMKIVRMVCIMFLCAQGLFSFAHAVILPTYHIDSLTNWTMRSKVSFYDHAIAFDTTETRGVAKPQYPFLFHALQIVVNEGNSVWSDRSANTILFVLTLSSFIALFLLLQRARGTDAALLTITFILGIPLLAFHASQGYGDLPLVLYLCLSFVTLFIARSERDVRFLLLSALFMVASVWTKSEGMIVGFVPWVLLVITDFFHAERKALLRWPLGIGTMLGLLWPAFLLLRGMGLTPHSTDTHLQWHPETLSTVLSGIFWSGSMGISFDLIIVLTVILFTLRARKDPRIDRDTMILGSWGLFSLLVVIGTYVLTPNAVFLVNGESFYRQLMIPAALLFVWFGCLWKMRKTE